MKFSWKITFLVLGLTLFLAGCKKSEGAGGESTIKGKVIVREYDEDFKVLQREIPATKEDVYISYGSNSSEGDKTTTSYDGSFEFDYLLPGNYTVYAYSDDTSKVQDKKIPVICKVKLADNKTSTLDSIIIYKKLKVDDGNATIKGKLVRINYRKDGFDSNIKDTIPGQEYDIYLIYNNHPSFDIRVRSNYDGIFEFPNLIKGSYVVYGYSEAHDAGGLTGATEKVAAKVYVTITEDNQVVSVNDTIRTF
jgi:hypothetical protein